MLPTGLQSPRSKASISYPKLLIVEGHDAFQVLKALLRHLGLLTEIEIRNAGGTADLSTFLQTIVEVNGFPRVTSVGIVRDAETNASSAFQSVCQALRKAGLNAPAKPLAVAEGRPKVSVFILPDCHGSGELESLCLEAVRSDTAMPCVDEYFQCLNKRGVPVPENLPKARLHTFLASRRKPDLLVGEAAHAGYFPWDSPAFDRLKEFLRAL